MKITSTILSIPPYLSTSWQQIASIETEFRGPSPILIIHLQDGIKKEIPNLDGATISQIFDTHAQYLDSSSHMPTEIPPFTLSLLKEGESISSFEDTLQHNSAQANIPNLPRPILEKIFEIAKVFGLEDTSVLPNPEQGCNCPHCQLVRLMKGEEPKPQEEEKVTDADLHFADWNIKQIDDKLYEVANPLDPNEHYQVFLGTPLGCTCGGSTCEHIQAVLRT